MNNETYAGLVSLGFVIIMILFIWFFSKGIDVLLDFQYERYNKRHPKYAKFNKEYGDKLHEVCKLYNDNITKSKSKIDRLQKDINYYNNDSIAYKKISGEIYALKNRIETYEKEDKMLHSELKKYVLNNVDDAISEVEGNIKDDLIKLKERYSSKNFEFESN